MECFILIDTDCSKANGNNIIDGVELLDVSDGYFKTIGRIWLYGFGG